MARGAAAAPGRAAPWCRVRGRKDGSGPPGGLLGVLVRIPVEWLPSPVLWIRRGCSPGRRPFRAPAAGDLREDPAPAAARQALWTRCAHPGRIQRGQRCRSDPGAVPLIEGTRQRLRPWPGPGGELLRLLGALRPGAGRGEGMLKSRLNWPLSRSVPLSFYERRYYGRSLKRRRLVLPLSLRP